MADVCRLAGDDRRQRANRLSGPGDFRLPERKGIARAGVARIGAKLDENVLDRSQPPGLAAQLDVEGQGDDLGPERFDLHWPATKNEDRRAPPRPMPSRAPTPVEHPRPVVRSRSGGKGVRASRSLKSSGRWFA